MNQCALPGLLDRTLRFATKTRAHFHSILRNISRIITKSPYKLTSGNWCKSGGDIVLIYVWHCTVHNKGININHTKDRVRLKTVQNQPYFLSWSKLICKFELWSLRQELMHKKNWQFLKMSALNMYIISIICISI